MVMCTSILQTMYVQYIACDIVIVVIVVIECVYIISICKKN